MYIHVHIWYILTLFFPTSEKQLKEPVMKITSRNSSTTFLRNSSKSSSSGIPSFEERRGEGMILARGDIIKLPYRVGILIKLAVGTEM